MLRTAAILLLMTAPGSLQAQALVCPPAATAGRPCERFHYHAQLYNPENRQFVTVSGTNQFSSQAACDRARDAQVTQNAAVVEYVQKTRGQKYEADRIGPCHCDATTEAGSATYLDDVQRLSQLRAAEDVRRRVREKLLDLDLKPEAPLVQSLSIAPAAHPFLSAPRLSVVPPSSAVVMERSANDLRMPKSTQPPATTSASINLPIAGLGGPPPAVAAPQAAQVAAADPATPAAPSAVPPAPATSASTTPAAPQVIETSVPVDEPDTAPADEQEQVIEIQHDTVASAEEAADAFVRLETERIQNVVNAIADPPDENGERTLEACTARIQALSNLRSIILGSGSSSRIAQAARAVRSEEDRLAIVKKLFGETVAAHWIPRVTTDVILPADSDAEANAAKLLRETSGEVSEEQRRALYETLSRAPISEEQQLGLIAVVDRFVQ